MKGDFEITWVDRGRPPRVAPNPDFPDGKEVDLRDHPDQVACIAALPYPTGHENIGGWFVRCKTCGTTAMITAASRPDDPKSLVIPCTKGAGMMQ